MPTLTDRYYEQNSTPRERSTQANPALSAKLSAFLKEKRTKDDAAYDLAYNSAAEPGVELDSEFEADLPSILARRIKQQREPSPLPDHEKSYWQTMNPADAFEGGAQAFERGVRRIPGSYGELVELAANYSLPGMLTKTATGKEVSELSEVSSVIHDIMGVYDIPAPDRPWQHVMGLTGEIGGDIAGWGASAKMLGKGRGWIDDLKQSEIYGPATDIKPNTGMQPVDTQLNPVDSEARRKFLQQSSVAGGAAAVGAKGIISLLPDVAKVSKGRVVKGTKKVDYQPTDVEMDKIYDDAWEEASSRNEAGDMTDYEIDMLVDDLSDTAYQELVKSKSHF